METTADWKRNAYAITYGAAIIAGASPERAREIAFLSIQASDDYFGE